MKAKQYNLFKTAKKTAQENNLMISNDGKTLYDFEVLNGMPITEWEKECIRKDALRNITAGNINQLYGCIYDNFSACDGMALYYCHKVFNKDTGKRLYVIMQLTAIKHYSKNRNSVYEKNYHVTTIETKSGYCEPFSDYEI